jgi:hypothetical protein
MRDRTWPFPPAMPAPFRLVPNTLPTAPALSLTMIAGTALAACVGFYVGAAVARSLKWSLEIESDFDWGPDYSV